MWCPQHNQYCYEDTCPHGGPRPEPMINYQPKPKEDPLESQDFYEMCQLYRHARDPFGLPGMPSASEAFENLKDWIRKNYGQN